MATLSEKAIIGKLVYTMLDAGFRIEFSDTDGGGLYMYAAENGEEKPEDGWKFWIRLVPGNGEDVISDYSTNLESTLKPVFKYTVAIVEAGG